MDPAISRIDAAILRLTNLNEGIVKLLAYLDDDRPTSKLFQKSVLTGGKYDYGVHWVKRVIGIY